MADENTPNLPAEANGQDSAPETVTTPTESEREFLDISAIMRMPDPFEDLQDEPEREAPPVESKAAVPVEKAVPATVAAPSAEPALTDRLAAALEGINTRLAEPAPRPAAPADPKTAEAQLETYLDKLYDFDVSPQTIAALQSENPVEVQSALRATMKTLAKLVHRNMARETQAAFLDVLSKRVPALINAAIQNEQSRQMMNVDFFAHYPELSAPELGEVVRGTFQLLLKENPAYQKQPWTPEFRDKLGERVLRALGVDPEARKARMAALPAAPSRQVPKPNQMLNGRASRHSTPAGGGGPNTQADIMSTLF